MASTMLVSFHRCQIHSNENTSLLALGAVWWFTEAPLRLWHIMLESTVLLTRITFNICHLTPTVSCEWHEASVNVHHSTAPWTIYLSCWIVSDLWESLWSTTRHWILITQYKNTISTIRVHDELNTRVRLTCVLEPCTNFVWTYK